MTSAHRSPLPTLAFAVALLAAPPASRATQGDCAQPVSIGAQPAVTDCLVVLQTAVGVGSCNAFPFCVCTPKGSGSPSATDALICLNVATGLDGAEALDCPCARCSSGEVVALAGSEVDSGWNGLGHGQSLIEGASIAVAVLKRCSNDDDTTCITDADCPAGGACKLTCNCDGADTECEVAGPTHERRCLRNLHVQCTTDADCPDAPAETCESVFGPPLPLSASETPACIVTYFAGPITGTADSGTGEGSIATFLRSVVHLGVAGSTPCPTCGTPSQNPEIGDSFTCGGGGINPGGTPCTVDAVSPDFGGVSFDCPPAPGANVSGVGLAVIFKQATTGSLGVQATLPCGFPLSQAHPDTGQASCRDDFSPCSTNADCTRCTDDFEACSTNADCTEGATCAEAPDQPVACGIYCHCGFCGGIDIDSPCFSDADCDEGIQCLPGTGQAGAPEPQTRDNNCSNLICGELVPEECCPGGGCINENTPGFGPSPEVGKCSDLTYILCNSNADCVPNGGTCEFEPASCFGAKIERTGTPDPLTSFCAPGFTTACTTNADCGGEVCEEIAEPVSVALFCLPPTTSQGINSAAGIPGPGVVTFRSRVIVARCGDGRVQEKAGEECDDGNLVNGDGCNESCLIEE